jgi:hypothetical protein
MPARNVTRFRGSSSGHRKRNESESDATNMLVELGNRYLLSGQYAIAERTFRSAQTRMVKMVPLPAVDLAIVLKGLSTAIRLSGDWAEASKLNLQAEELLEDQRETLEYLFSKPSIVPPGENKRQPVSCERPVSGERFQLLLKLIMWTLLITAYSMMAVIMYQCLTCSTNNSYVGCGRGAVFSSQYLRR